MKKISFRYFLFLLLPVVQACEPEQYGWISSSFSCGVLSNEVTSYAPGEMTFNTRFFVFDKEESDQLTQRDVEHNIRLSSLEVDAVMTGFREVSLPPAGKYSCAVLLDDVYNKVNYDYFEKFSSTEIFLRKFFKNAGLNNYVRLAIMQDQTPPVKLYGKYFTKDASGMDLLLADLLSDPEEPFTQIPRLPLLQSLDILLDTINRSAAGTNRNLLLIYSRNAYIQTGITAEMVIAKAKTYGIKVSSIIGSGGIYYIDYNLNSEDLFFRLAHETGGFVYMNNDILNGKDILILASRLADILEGNFKCFEATWKLTPAGSWTDPFQPGYFAQGEIMVDLQTGYDKETFSMPLGIIIK